MLHADLAAGDLAAAETHAAALAAVPARHARAFAAAAACWLRVARGDVDPEEVRAAAIGLHHAGLTADGAQLAASASVRTADRKEGAGLMAFARNLSDSPAVEPAPPAARSRWTPRPRRRGRPADTAVQPSPASRTTAPLLSEREVEVGRLILAGLTHKQIGARLFISAKTVEHHVARMRNRLGADGRNELFGMLRTLIGDADQEAAKPKAATSR